MDSMSPESIVTLSIAVTVGIFVIAVGFAVFIVLFVRRRLNTRLGLQSNHPLSGLKNAVVPATDGLVALGRPLSVPQVGPSMVRSKDSGGGLVHRNLTMSVSVEIPGQAPFAAEVNQLFPEIYVSRLTDNPLPYAVRISPERHVTIDYTTPAPTGVTA